MAFSNGFAVAVKVDGKVVQERQDGVVPVPFGSDYVIRLINKNSRRALAKVYIDGQNVSGAGGLVLYPHGDYQGRDVVDLERPTDKAVTFRFASTESRAAAEHGKAGPDVDGDKGLIRVEWTLEKEILPYGTGCYGALSSPLKRMRNSPPVSNYEPTITSSLSSGPSCTSGYSSTMDFCDYERDQKTSGGIVTPDDSTARTLSKSGTVRDLESGVTVEGRYSSQGFQSVAFNVDYAATPTVVMLKLKGYTASEGRPVEGTRYCPQCSATTKKLTDRFCRSCGERL